MKRILPAILVLTAVCWWSLGQIIPPPGGGSGRLSFLFGPLENGQMMQYNSTAAKWTNAPAPAGTGDMTQAAYDADANGVVDLGAGGTGSNLADPGADRIMFWDDSAGSNDWLTVGAGLSVTGTEITASAATTPTNFPNATVTNTFAALGNATIATNLTVGGTNFVADASGYSFTDSPTYRLYKAGAGSVDIELAGSRRHAFTPTAYVLLSSSAEIQLNSTTVLATDGPDILALRRGANDYTLRAYGTYTDPSNGKWIEVLHDGTTATVAARANGTGGADANLLLKAQGAGSVIAAGIQIDDLAYDATTWDGSTNAPTRNAVRDKIEALSIGAGVDHTGIVDGENTGTLTNFLRADIVTLNVTTQNVDELNVGDLNADAIIADNIQPTIAAVADATIVDFTFVERDAITLAGDLTLTHATNGAAGLTAVRMFRGGGSDRALVIPAWQTNSMSAVPANITNGFLTIMYLRAIGTTADAASQTNALVSFEYFKVQ